MISSIMNRIYDLSTPRQSKQTRGSSCRPESKVPKESPLANSMLPMQRHNNLSLCPRPSNNPSQLEDLLMSCKEFGLGTIEGGHGATDNLSRLIVELINRGAEDGLEDRN